MNDEAVGFILKQTDYHDYDVILSCFTREYGRISLVAAGGRRVTSKNAGAILPYTKARLLFNYKEGKTMFRLKTASTVSLYRKSHEDLFKSAAAAAIGETVDLMSMPGYENDRIDEQYDLLERSFAALEEDYDPTSVLCLFLCDLMSMDGISPNVDECVHCGKTSVITYSEEEGGFLCSEHARRAGLEAMSRSDLYRLRLIVKGGMDHLDTVIKEGGAEPGDLDLLGKTCRKFAGIDLRCLTFYLSLFAVV